MGFSAAKRLSRSHPERGPPQGAESKDPRLLLSREQGVEFAGLARPWRKPTHFRKFGWNSVEFSFGFALVAKDNYIA
jgi:hypothetical protein